MPSWTENLVVIFGAGASYDSSPDFAPGSGTEARLPLANGLFDLGFGQHLEGRNEIKGIVPQLRAEAKKKHGLIESALKRISDKAAKDPELRKALIAIRYYLRDLLAQQTKAWLSDTRGVTNYVALVKQIDSWRRQDAQKRRAITYVTFNYDRLLEEAILQELPRLGFTFADFADYCRREECSVIKVHGSVDWVERVSSSVPYTISPDSAARDAEAFMIANANEITPRGLYAKLEAVETGALAIPALAIPLENKAEFMCPPYILGHLDAKLGAADKILMIGWRGTERPFVELLAKHMNARRCLSFCVVGKDKADASAIWDRIALSPAKPVEVRHGTRGFSEFIGAEELDQFLEAPLPFYAAPITG